MTAFLDQFSRDKDIPEWYIWSTNRPFFTNAEVRYSLWCDGQCFSNREGKEKQDNIEVMAICENGNALGEYHENAWNFIQENSNSIEQELRRKLWVVCHSNFSEFTEALETDDEEWIRMKDAVDWEAKSSLEVQVELTSITLIDDGIDEIGFSCFDFSVGWDDEHGISVLMHKDNVLAASCCGDFSNRGPNLIPHAKAIQEFDFAEGDFRIVK